MILDIVTDDEKWGDWSASRLADAAREGRLVINPLIYAEVSCGFERIEDLEAAVPPAYFVREPLPWAAAFLAASPRRTGARCGAVRRRRSGWRRGPTP